MLTEVDMLIESSSNSGSSSSKMESCRFLVESRNQAEFKQSENASYFPIKMELQVMAPSFGKISAPGDRFQGIDHSCLTRNFLQVTKLQFCNWNYRATDSSIQTKLEPGLALESIKTRISIQKAILYFQFQIEITLLGKANFII